MGIQEKDGKVGTTILNMCQIMKNFIQSISSMVKEYTLHSGTL